VDSNVELLSEQNIRPAPRVCNAEQSPKRLVRSQQPDYRCVFGLSPSENWPMRVDERNRALIVFLGWTAPELSRPSLGCRLLVGD
jgi:hypothetical protein